MPYCSKCGVELDEETKFCPTCGTPVGPLSAEPERRRKERRVISPLAIILIALIAIATVIATLVFLPIRTVDISESRAAPYQTGVNILDLDFTADVASVNIAFEDLVGNLVTLDVSVTGRIGTFSSTDVLDLTFEATIAGNVLTVTSEIDVIGRPISLNVTCDIRIDPSMNASLDVKTSTGGIVMDTQAGVTLNSLNLEATTGGVQARLGEDTVVSGDASLKTTTGGVELSWDDVNVTDDVQVNAITTTGGVDVDVTQDAGLLGNVTLRAEATTGGVYFDIYIRGDLGAKIESIVTTGGINIERQVGFSGTEALLWSDNYPASSNFDISLKTITGGINVDAKHTP